MTYEEAVEIRNRAARDLLLRPGVHGVEVEGADVWGLVVLVESKRNVAPEETIPEEIEGLPVRVQQETVAAPLGRLDTERPAYPGCSVSHPKVSRGSIGPVVRKKIGGERYFLSNNHVIANENVCRIGDPILQRGRHDGGKQPADTIGYLDDFEPLYFETLATEYRAHRNANGRWFIEGRQAGERWRRVIDRWQYEEVAKDAVAALEAAAAARHDPSSLAGINVMDAALAKARDLSPIVPRLGNPSGLAIEPGSGEMALFGATSGLMKGTITSPSSTRSINMGAQGILLQHDVIVTTHMANGGDSGSAVWDEGMNFVGLLFAGSSSSSLICKAKYLLPRFGVEIARA